MSDKLKELEKLREEERLHSRLYYQESTPEISDKEYDDLKKRVREEEKGLNLQASEKVGFLGENTPFEKHPHTRPMLSLENGFSLDEIKLWIDRLEKSTAGKILGKDYTILGEVKLDGVSLSMKYEEGRLIRTLTRGNGLEGEDVTHNLHYVSDIPVTIESGNFEVRGEVYATFDNFELANTDLEKPFATPRNLASGTLRQKQDSSGSRNLNFIAFDLITDLFFRDREAIIQHLKTLGFNIPINSVLRSMDEIESFYNKTLNSRDEIPYPIDGLVYKVNDVPLCEVLGASSHHPRWAVAHKMPSEKVVTLLKDMICQVSREGVITPVAVLDEVNVGGVKVHKASLHNFPYIKDKAINKMDKVEVERAGDVIPQVVRLVEHTDQSSPLEMPSVCPSCSGNLTYVSPYLYCKNSPCPAKSVAKLVHFVSKDGLDIENLGFKTLELLFKENLVSKPADIFKLKYEDLDQLEGFQDKSINNLLQGIDKARQVTFSRFLFSLGMPQFGIENCKLVAQHYTLQEFLSENLSEIEDLSNIGAKTALQIRKFIEANKKDMNELVSYLQITQDQKVQNRGVVVFTGKLSLPRSIFKREAEALHFAVGSQISSKTNCVVVGESAGSKLDAAKEKGLRVFNEDQWKSFIGEIKHE